MTRLKRISKDAAVKAGIDYYYDPAAAKRVVDFFETFLHHSKGKWAGKPFTLLDWQREDIVEELFGWLRVKDDLRRYRMAYVEVPKKNGKSTLLSGIGLYLLVADGERGSEVYGCASDRQQASICYREAAECVRQSPHLAKRLEVIESRKTITFVATSSVYRVLSADGFRAEGLNIHGLLFDELHAQRDRRLFDALRYGGAARDQPLLMSISTAGYDRTSICYEQRAYAERVIADWTADPTFMAYVRCAEAEDDWKSPDVWRKANPSFGITIKEDDFAAEAKEAELSTSKLNSFLRYRLNVWTSQDTRWLKPETWQACNGGPPHDLAGRECFCGLDLASTYDTSAFVAVFPCDDGSVDVLVRFWIPNDNMVEREKRDRVPFQQWVTGGFVNATSGNVTDYDVIRRDIVEFSQQHGIKKLALDRWNATQLANQLQGDGINVALWPQGFAGMNAPSQLLSTLLSAGKLRHAGQPVLQWMAGNVAIRQNADGHIRPVKPKENSHERVDGIIALVMALGAWSAESKEPPQPEPEIIIL